MGTFRDYIPLIINTTIGIILIAIGEEEVGVGILVAAASGRAITVGVNQANTKGK